MGNYLFAMTFAFILVLNSCGKASKSSQDTAPENQAQHDHSQHHHSENAVGMATSDARHFMVSVVWEPHVLQAGLNIDHIAHLNFFDPEGGMAMNVDFETFHVHMPMMGHGTDTSNQVIASTDKAHHWRVEGVSFSMLAGPGHWKATITAKVNGMLDTVTVDLPAVVQ